MTNNNNKFDKLKTKFYFRDVLKMGSLQSHEERSEMPGLIALRVDMIVVATLLTQYIVEELNIEELLISEYSLKERILFELICGKEI